MSMQATVYGRAAFEPRQHQTKAGKPMASARLAVDVTGKDDEQQTLWLDVLAFGRAADDLARVEKGGMVSAMGRVTRGTYTAKDGTERESWTLLADAVITARSGRPGQRRQPQQRAPAPAPFDDAMPW